MAAITLSGYKTFVTVLDSGKKMVVTDVWTDDGTTVGNIVINPLVVIDEMAFYPKTPNTTFEVVLGASAASGTNKVFVTPAADSSGANLTIVSFGY